MRENFIFRGVVGVVVWMIVDEREWSFFLYPYSFPINSLTKYHLALYYSAQVFKSAVDAGAVEQGDCRLLHKGLLLTQNLQPWLWN